MSSIAATTQSVVNDPQAFVWPWCVLCWGRRRGVENEGEVEKGCLTHRRRHGDDLRKLLSGGGGAGEASLIRCVWAASHDKEEVDAVTKQPTFSPAKNAPNIHALSATQAKGKPHALMIRNACLLVGLSVERRDVNSARGGMARFPSCWCCSSLFSRILAPFSMPYCSIAPCFSLW